MLIHPGSRLGVQTMVASPALLAKPGVDDSVVTPSIALSKTVSQSQSCRKAPWLSPCPT
ncbi:hypothetical protein I79_004662 [Cricetulus griseus]|uniref:Uncharacterized protein n=1 Tax=Cricetulus griseus TaxID=10029 RepID=G3H351_CRIGR|nr:hypothetical protein I79_004662 [Cricetulus griseus]